MPFPSTLELFALLEANSRSIDFTIAEGDLVASFDSPHDDMRFGRSERTSGIIGRVLAITEPIEGCCRYKIQVHAFFRGDSVEEPERTGILCHPPLNGTLNLTRNAQTFGVVKLPRG